MSVSPGRLVVIHRWQESHPGYQAAATKKWRQSHPAQWAAIQAARNDRRRDRGLELTRSVKDVPCADCGGRFPPECMDFDHVRGEKIAGVAQLLKKTAERIMSEIAKCEVVCSNCHRIRTKARRRLARPSPLA